MVGVHYLYHNCDSMKVVAMLQLGCKLKVTVGRIALRRKEIVLLANCREPGLVDGVVELNDVSS